MGDLIDICLVNERKQTCKVSKDLTGLQKTHCGVMKLLADMPSRLGGEEHRINVM
jgi:hypothetical protein